MSSNKIVASQEDYVKFKKFLQFFVWQSSKNADNGRAESPTKNKNFDSTDNLEFTNHYGLDSDFNKMVNGKLNFTIRFFMCGRFNSELSTYINIELLNIIGKFEKGKIVALKNLIRLDIPSISIEGELRKRCEERNEQSKDPYYLKDLGISKDCPQEKISEALKTIIDANDSLKKMLDEYLEIYNEFYEEIKLALGQPIGQPKEKIGTRTLEQEISDFIEEFKENMKQSNILPSATSKLYHYTTLTTLKKIIENNNLRATHIKYLNDKGEIKYVLEKLFFPAIDNIIPNIDDIYNQTREILKQLKNDIAKPTSIDLYITSFSAKSDTLSQWRGYGKGYDSVCIGFDVKKMIGTSSNRIGLFKVKYEDDYDELSTYLSNIKDILLKHPKEKINENEELYMSLLEILFIYFAKTKDTVWVEEDESRLIYHSKQDRNGKKIDPEFRVDGKRYLIPYISENLFEISEIILPQSDNFESIKMAIEKLLKEKGRNEKIEITESKIPIAYEEPSKKFLETFTEQPKQEI